MNSQHDTRSIVKALIDNKLSIFSNDKKLKKLLKLTKYYYRYTLSRHYIYLCSNNLLDIIVYSDYSTFRTNDSDNDENNLKLVQKKLADSVHKNINNNKSTTTKMYIMFPYLVTIWALGDIINQQHNNTSSLYIMCYLYKYNSQYYNNFVFSFDIYIYTK